MCDVLSGIIIKLQLQLGDKQCGRECAKSAQKTVGRLLRKCQIKFIDFHCSFEMEAVTPAGGPGSLKCEKPMTGDEGLTMCTFFFVLLLSDAGSSVWILLVALVDLSCTFPTPNPCLCAIKAPLSTFECLPSDFTSAISDSLRQSVELSSRTPCKITNYTLRNIKYDLNTF